MASPLGWAARIRSTRPFRCARERTPTRCEDGSRTPRLPRHHERADRADGAGPELAALGRSRGDLGLGLARALARRVDLVDPEHGDREAAVGSLDELLLAQVPQVEREQLARTREQALELDLADRGLEEIAAPLRVQHREHALAHGAVLVAALAADR